MVTVKTNLIAGNGDVADPVSTKKDRHPRPRVPVPRLRSWKLAQSAEPKDVLEIISNDEYTASTSIPSVLKIRQFDYSVVKNEDGTFSIKARKA